MDHKELVVLVLDTKTSGKTTERVRECVEQHKCLVCETNSKLLRRGLCIKCYTSWGRSRSRMSIKDALQFDARLIRRGLLLVTQQIRKIKQDSIFERLAN